MTASLNLVGCDFECFGKALKYSGIDKEMADRAKEDNIRGWCKYTESGSFKGHIEGDRGFLERMQNWLKSPGIKKCKIDRIFFLENCPINQFKYEDFQIRKKD